LRSAKALLEQCEAEWQDAIAGPAAVGAIRTERFLLATGPILLHNGVSIPADLSAVSVVRSTYKEIKDQ